MKRTTCALVLAAALSGQETVRDIMIERAPAGAGPGNVMFFTGMAGAPVKGVPYSADTITETRQVLADGNRIVRSNKSSFARDSQGRTRQETEIKHLGPLGQTDQPLVSVFITDPVARMHYHLDTRSKTVTRLPLPAGDGAGGARWQSAGGAEFDIQLRGPAGGDPPAGVRITRTEVRDERVMVPGSTVRGMAMPDNVQSEDLGEKSFDGVTARGVRTTLVIPAGEAGNEKPLEVVTEHWRSPALKVAVYTRHSDPRFGETITRLTNVQMVEPSAHLFQVPADYQEASPASPGVHRRVLVREE